MSVSSIFILDDYGKKLIHRDYRGDIDTSCIQKFYKYVSEAEMESTITPVFMRKNITYMYIKNKNLYFVAIANFNASALVILNFLYKFIKVIYVFLNKILTSYFNVVTEESVRDNFGLIYEILDEIMDYGYPQLTEPDVLQAYIFQSGQKLEQIKAPPAVTNAVSWRKEGIKYRKNEIFVDVNEKINLIVNSQGNILTNDINGTMLVNCHLSGMPELTSNYKQHHIASFVEVRIPVPPNLYSPVFDTRSGNCKYSPEENCVIWTLNSFPGKKEAVLIGVVHLPVSSNEKQSLKSNITVSFEIPYFSISGLNIRYLKVVDKGGYNCISWVRYFSTHGAYEFRI
ncbi:hypothetical protein HZS_6883 [Henneguya salminicola]|nr:hypothetical protein HZS_6883 [Henneguya salminicola]